MFAINGWANYLNREYHTLVEMRCRSMCRNVCNNVEKKQAASQVTAHKDSKRFPNDIGNMLLNSSITTSDIIISNQLNKTSKLSSNHKVEALMTFASQI